MSIECLVSGDVADGGPEKAWTAMLAAEYAAGQGISYAAHLCVGDACYDGSWKAWCGLWDPSWGRYNPITLLAPGNHDYQNPDASLSFVAAGNHIARWAANAPSTNWTIGVGTNNHYRFCCPTTAARQNFCYRVKAAGTTGGSEPDWTAPAEGGHMLPGKTVRDGSVVWECIDTGADMWAYVNGHNLTAGADRRAATRPATSKPMTLMSQIHPGGWGVWPGGSDLLNPHSEYGAIDLHGTDADGTFTWRAYLLNTELEWGRRTGDAHAARGYGPGEAGIAINSLQYKWLQADLAAHASRKKIMVLHWPWFYLQDGGHPGVADVYRLFMAYGGKVILAGHQHHYARFRPVSTSQAGTVQTRVPNGYAAQVVIGNGGHAASGSFDWSGKGTLLGTTQRGGLAAVGKFGMGHLRLHRHSYDWTALCTAQLGDYPRAGGASVFDTLYGVAV